MNDPYLSCREEGRRDDVRRAPLFGLDFVDVSDDELTLEVFFLGKAPEKIEKANIAITGGRRIRDLEVTDLRVFRQPDPILDDYMEVRVDKPGDFSTYTLGLVKLDDKGRPTNQLLDGFDPRYVQVDFTFKAGCPSDLDCKPQQVCPPPQRTQPEINYLAKDYASFQQLIYDRLALIMPEWQERHVPDIGVALVELLAYAGDYLSYYQDAVATEAYLRTARQRISVRRHSRLMDYAMHEGCNSRAWLTISTDKNTSLSPSGIFFCTALPDKPDKHVLQPADLNNIPAGSIEFFEALSENPTQPIVIYAAHSEIHFYTWGDCECCLAIGATSATLVDFWEPAAAGGNGSPPSSQPAPSQPAVPRARAQDQGDGPTSTVRALKLKVSDVLIFEEVIGPGTGNPADADPRHRQAVRLTKVTPAIDPLYHPHGADFGQPVVDIEWCSEDALTFALCISAKMPPPDCTCKENISVARGNVVLVDNGLDVDEEVGTVLTRSTTETCATDCDPGETVVVPRKFRPTLKQRPLTFSQPLPACGCARALIGQDPRQALPRITLTGTQATAGDPVVTTWLPKRDLLESGGSDRNFVVEMDNDGDAHIRFGDGQAGRMPDAGTAFQAAYRVGNGPAGNVGAETITCVAFRKTNEGGPNPVPRNPMPAAGGTAPEPLAEVKMFAPFTFRHVLERAITADDYAAIAADNDRRLAERPALLAQATGMASQPESAIGGDPRRRQEEEPGASAIIGTEICFAPFHPLQGAKATLRWTGGWYEALIAVDPLGSETADPELLAEITAYLEPYRRIGHDLMVRPAQYVPIDLGLSVCVLPQYQRGHVKAALLDAFSNRMLPDGQLGFFHPDNLSFGQGVYVSRIIAAAQAVAGVQDVEVTRLERFEIGEPPPGADLPGEELPAHGVLAVGPFEIARLDNDPNFPENGRLILQIRGGR